jgi:hypothetical protein
MVLLGIPLEAFDLSLRRHILSAKMARVQSDQYQTALQNAQSDRVLPHWHGCP